MIRVGVDVGGTFTDVVVLDEESGVTSWSKRSTEPERPAAGVLEAVAQSGAPAASMSHLKLGTTLALNAILTRGGAKTGLITTDGFRDVLEIRRTHRNRLFDLDERLPEPLVPRDLRFEVRERLGFDGRVVAPLDEGGVLDAWRALRQRGVRSVAIAFLFSFQNPAHEQRAREIVLEEGGADAVFISSDVLPVQREYERTSTTVAAAYVAPLVDTYLRDLEQRLEVDGFRHGRLSVLTNSGGVMSAETASRVPIPTLLSGPAGGVAAMRWLAEREGIEDVVTFDMGGTSTDVSGVIGGVPDERLDMEIDGHAISYPSFDINTIGAGGGSIAWIDESGLLHVGPSSAGSAPGPACYGAGGTRPTVTDANLVLGRYSSTVPLGDTIDLDPDAARTAIQSLAGPLGLSVDETAAGIVRIVNSHMVNAVRTISVERGRDPRRLALAAFGGAGPTHAAEIAAALSIPRIIVPPFPGCASAFGAVVSRTRRDHLRAVARDVDELSPGELNEVLGALRTRCVEDLSNEGFPDAEITLETWINLHYQGQAYDLAIPHPAPEATRESLGSVLESFRGLHQQLYGHAFDDVPVEMVSARVTGFAVQDEPEMVWEWGPDAQAAAGEGVRSVHFDAIEDAVEARVLGRSQIAPGAAVDGPAVVHQVDSTILIPPGFSAHAQSTGSLVLSAAVADPREPATASSRASA